MPKAAAVATNRPATARNGMYFLLPSVSRRNVTCSFLGTAPPAGSCGPGKARSRSANGRSRDDRLAHAAPCHRANVETHHRLN